MAAPREPEQRFRAHFDGSERAGAANSSAQTVPSELEQRFRAQSAAPREPEQRFRAHFDGSERAGAANSSAQAARSGPSSEFERFVRQCNAFA